MSEIFIKFFVSIFYLKANQIPILHYIKKAPTFITNRPIADKWMFLLQTIIVIVLRNEKDPNDFDMARC